MRNNWFLLVPLSLTFSLTPHHLIACEAQEMATTANGFVHKVVAGSDKIKVYKTESTKEELFAMELLQPYFVICETGDYYRITDVPADTVEEALTGNVGYVPKLQTHLWPTREALDFSQIAFIDERPEIVAWDDELVLKKYMETGDVKLHAPAFKEDLESTRMRERATRPYPVLGSMAYPFRGVGEKRVYNVLLPAALTPGKAKVEIKEGDVEVAKKAWSSVTIVVVFDATGSMGPFASETARAITKAIERIPADVVAKSNMGFVFYRDADDDERLVAIEPIPFADAAKALHEAADLMTGGGDSAEPILDATYFAAHLYKWGQHGRRIIIGVLNDDAKPTTEGAIDSEGRIPAGRDVNQIVAALREQTIPMITVQAGPTFGSNLEVVLQTLAEGTGGNFIKWETGSTENAIAEAVMRRAEKETVESVKKAQPAVNALEEKRYWLEGHASIPLEVVDGEMLDRLRRNGVEFNIDPGAGGVLVREGYIIQNDDLLTPKIQIEKETLMGLINLYSVLGTTGLDSQTFLQSAAEAIAAIAGEKYDETDTISEIIQKNLGIEFRSELLNFDLQFLDTLVPAERLKFAARIQSAGNTLGQYLEANLAEFDSQPAVWMPVSALP